MSVWWSRERERASEGGRDRDGGRKGRDKWGGENSGDPSPFPFGGAERKREGGREGRDGGREGEKEVLLTIKKGVKVGRRVG